jgi:hypothetical protein
MLNRPARLVLAVLLALPAAACSDNPDRMRTYPVTGRVLLNGKPLAGATVCLIPGERDKYPRERPSGTTDKEGKFQLSTYVTDDGAPVGDYGVIVYQLKEGAEEGSDQKVPNLLPAKYLKPETSGLKYSVRPGPNEMPPIELKK